VRQPEWPSARPPLEHIVQLAAEAENFVGILKNQLAVYRQRQRRPTRANNSPPRNTAGDDN